MNDPLPLCSVTDTRALTNVQSGYNELDEAIRTFIPTASSQVRTFCRRDFVRKERTEHYMSPASYAGAFRIKLIEDNLDPAGPLSVLYNPRGDFRQGSAYVLTGIDMEVDYEAGEITLYDGAYTQARKGIRVVYTGGYPEIEHEGDALLNVPAAVRNATALQAAAMFSKARGAGLGKTSVAQNQGGITENYDRGGITGLIKEASGPLVGFRRALIGRT